MKMKNQGRLHQCKVCHKFINSEKDFNNHMLNEHLIVGDNITNKIETIEDSVPENVIDSITEDLNNHMVDEHLPIDNNIMDETETMEDPVSEKVIDSNTKEVDKNEDTFSVDEVLFVKRKTIYWPAKLIEVNEWNIVVQIFHIKNNNK